jgi:hypothetical protein
MYIGIPSKGRERSQELHFNDAFKNAQEISITGSGQRLKPRFSPDLGTTRLF